MQEVTPPPQPIIDDLPLGQASADSEFGMTTVMAKMARDAAEARAKRPQGISRMEQLGRLVGKLKRSRAETPPTLTAVDVQGAKQVLETGVPALSAIPDRASTTDEQEFLSKVNAAIVERQKLLSQTSGVVDTNRSISLSAYDDLATELPKIRDLREVIEKEIALLTELKNGKPKSPDEFKKNKEVVTKLMAAAEADIQKLPTELQETMRGLLTKIVTGITEEMPKK